MGDFLHLLIRYFNAINMSKIPIIFCFLVIHTLAHNGPTYVKGRGYEGYVFEASHPLWFTGNDPERRFTPSRDEIRYAEGLLKKQIRVLNARHENQIGHCPIIDKNLRKYKRQYVGLLNAENEKIIWFNCIWGKKAGSEISKEIIQVFDGCSYYWGVKINLNTGVVYDLTINGLG